MVAKLRAEISQCQSQNEQIQSELDTQRSKNDVSATVASSHTVEVFPCSASYADIWLHLSLVLSTHESKL